MLKVPVTVQVGVIKEYIAGVFSKRLWLRLNLTERLPAQEQKFGFAVSAGYERKLYGLRGAGNRR
jgi:hypothetical protein